MHEQMAADNQLADHFVSRIAERLTRLASELRQIDGALGDSEGRVKSVLLPGPVRASGEPSGAGQSLH